MNDLFWIIVLYNKNPIIPTSLKILDNIFNINCDSIHHILIYDNSVYPLKDIDDFFMSKNVVIEYIHNPLNPGLAKAYNHALQIANSIKKKWLVLLDQDSILDNNFLNNLNNSININFLNSNVVAIIPRVFDGSKLVSPSTIILDIFINKFKFQGFGITEKNITAINSGSAISVEYLLSIGGFNNKIPLDILDHWLFYTIRKSKKEIYLNSNIIQHSLSVTNAPMSIYRYRATLNAEKYLYCDIGNNYIKYIILLLMRLSKQLLYLRFQLAQETFLFLIGFFKFHSILKNRFSKS
jgi:GT2 family glycosyltransferase